MIQTLWTRMHIECLAGALVPLSDDRSEALLPTPLANDAAALFRPR
jgi:hypothetical protein